jgi:hypothetical protein
MKRDATDVDLTKVNVEPIDMPHHRMELRRTLLASRHWRKSRGGLFSKGEGAMRKRVFVAAGAALGLAAVVLVIGMVFVPANTNTAYAAELAQKSYQAVAALPPGQQGELVRKLHVSDPKALLQEAKNAKDLKVLTYDQFISQHPMPTPPASPNGKGPDLRSLTYLQFTDADGSQVVLGIDKNSNLPAIISVSVSNTAPGLLRFVVTPSAGMQSKGSNSVSSDGSPNSASFQMKVGDTTVSGTISADGTGTFLVNGKKYVAPAGTKFSMDQPPSVEVEGGNVYANGVKLIPEN